MMKLIWFDELNYAHTHTHTRFHIVERTLRQARVNASIMCVNECVLLRIENMWCVRKWIESAH